jgi:beta-lactamase class A
MPTYQRYQTLSPRPSRPSPKTPRTFGAKFRKIALWGVCLLLLTSTVSAGLSIRANQHAAAEAAWRQQQRIIFADTVNKIKNNNPRVEFAVSAVAVGGDQIQSLGDRRPFDAASTAKVLTAVFYVKQVESGRFTLDQAIGDKTARRQLQLMLQQSDDNAWELLNQAVGHDRLQQYAEGLGLNSYNVQANLMTSADLAKLLKDLAGGQLLSAAHTGLLLSYMQNTNYEDFISPAVPAGYRLYHKVGIDEDVINDTAIIAAPDGKAFVISIMTDGQGLYQWSNRAEMMQEIAAAAIKAYLQ